MNTKTLKGMGAAALLIGIGAASPALATSTGAQELDFAKTSIDVWSFSCPNATESAQAQVLDTLPVNGGPNPAAEMQVVLGNGSFPTVQEADNGDDDADPSPNAVAPNGPGPYAVAFKKTENGIEGYEGRVRCVDAAGNSLDPALTRLINQ